MADTKLDILSKQGLLIAGLSIVQLCYMLFMSALELSGHGAHASFRRSKRYVEDYPRDYDEDSEQSSNSDDCYNEMYAHRDYNEVSLIVAIVGIILAVLMIFGIVKKNKKFVAPFIAIFALGVFAYFGFYIYSLFDKYPTTDFADVLDTICYHILSLYTAVMIYLQMRREENEKEKKEEEATQDVKVKCQPKFNPYYVETTAPKAEENVV